MANIERNAPCPCGSGKKYKKCCCGKQPSVAADAVACDIQKKNMQIQNCMINYDFRQAESLSREVLRHQPDNPSALHSLGVIAQYAEAYQDSINLLLQVISYINDANHLHFLHYELGQSYLLSEQFQEAATHFQIAENHNVIVSDYPIFKGVALWMQGDHGGAEKAFQRAREINPEDPDNPTRYLSAFLHETGKLDEALELYCPVAQAALYSDAPRKPFYEYEKMTRSETAAGQSERYNMTPELKEMMVVSIRDHLQLSPDDTLLDIGGAGGLFTIELATFVKAVMLTDIHKDLVALAKENTKHLGNVETCVDDAVSMSNIHGTYSKMLMYGVTQCMTDFPSFERVLVNMYDRLSDGGRVLIGYNIRLGDVRRDVKVVFDSFKDLKSGYKVLDISHLRNILFMMENAFRIDVPRLMEACKRIGFRQVSTEPNPFVTSRGKGGYMFDLILEK
jgi:protein-L-isoaspartate O-methyltransferase/Tfp pilus assembly protein PilF